MSSTVGFFVFAAVMILAACATVALPLLRERGGAAPLAAGAVIAALPLATLVLYFLFSNWPWQGSPQAAVDPEAASLEAASLEEMVARLQQRLQAQPADAEGWQMLGRSLAVMGRYEEALGAYQQARDLTGDRDVHALTGYAEALGMMRGGQLDAESGALFEQALKLAPDDRKALWYGGLSAAGRGDAAVAKQRWQRLLSFDPPEEMAQLLREQIAAAQSMATRDVQAGAQREAPTQAQPGGGTAAGVAGLEIEVALDTALQAPASALVFVLARAVGQPGPPIAAVRRSVADLPLQLVLTDADAMMAGRTLSMHEQVEVIVRIALGGTPNAQPGDMYGSAVVASDGRATITIDRVH